MRLYFKKSVDFLLILSTIPCKKYCKFRTSNVKLPIETGRWLNIPKDNIICKLCDCNKIGDEFHYLFKCTDVYISNSTVICLPTHFINPNIVKFETLFSVTNINQPINICKLLNTIFERVVSLGLLGSIICFPFSMPVPMTFSYYILVCTYCALVFCLHYNFNYENKVHCC